MSAVFEKSPAYIELDEYLALERASAFRHEYLDGVIYAVQGEPTRGMAGGTLVHADIVRNTGYALHGKLKGSGCRVNTSDLRLRIDAAGAVFYPDVLVHCRPVPDPGNTTELSSARLVVEVLSQHTQRFDRGAKLAAYRQLSGLRTVLLLSSLEQAAWVLERPADDGEWGELRSWTRGTELVLTDLGIGLTWDEVYAGVGLP